MTRRQAAALLGVACGFSAAAFILPGGLDAYLFFLRDWFPETTAPAWGYLITTPIGKFPWPFSWAVWTALSVIIIGFTLTAITKKNRWYLVIFSPFFLNDFWLGQTECLSVAGLFIGMAVSRQKLPGWLMGIAWVLLLTKPQTGLAAAILFAFWLIFEKRWKDLLFSGLWTLVILAACFVFWPTWLINWIHILQAFSPSPSGNASVGWIGLLALIPLLISGRGSKERQLRMFLTANLLFSPYFTLYHCTVYQSTEDRVKLWAFSWVIFLSAIVLKQNFIFWIPLIPIASLAMDTWALLLLKPFSIPQNNKAAV